jgi:hypothetical protein
MTSSPTVAAAAVLVLAACTVVFGATAVVAQPSLAAPSNDLPKAPSAPLAPTVHQQAVAAAPIPPIELWHGATLGMTLEQLKTLLPSGHSPNSPPTEDDGSQPLWQMSDQVYGRDGDVSFYFRNGGLTSVLVDLSDVKPNATIGNMQDARALENAFSGYYGKPKLCFDSTARGLDQVDCRWEGHGIRIGLSYQDFGGASPRMAVAIRPVPPPPKAKTPFFGKRARKGASTS